MKFGVVIFPGSNCEQDCYWAVQITGGIPSYIWHQEKDLTGYDCIILPGGFSYGDYLRTGAVAKFSPVMEAIQNFAAQGGLVIGICNGFQILLEAGLLPGAMLPNRNLKFICRYVHLRVENNQTPFTRETERGEILRIPIAHYEGNYFAPPETLKEMERNSQIILRYCDENGNVTEEANPNGSLDNIAGIVNKEKNILGLMPHPERAVEKILGSEDGRKLFKSIIKEITGNSTTEKYSI